QYGPARMIVAIVGAVPAEDALHTLQTILGDWENAEQQTDFQQPDVPPLDGIRYTLHVLPGKTQSDIVLGVPGPSRMAADYEAARMVNNVLGVFGMMGRLGANVREKKGLAYYSYSNLAGGLGPGAWRVMAGVSPANVRLAVASIREEIERVLNEPVSPDDLADNVANFTGRLPLMLESNAGVASNLVSMERYGLGLDYLQKYGDILHALTVEDLQAAMRRYWRADAFALGVAGPEIAADFV
ncbi:MAG: M16 family metallopeptidase, partial [Anaerolineales bacterium]